MGVGRGVGVGVGAGTGVGVGPGVGTGVGTGVGVGGFGSQSVFVVHPPGLPNADIVTAGSLVVGVVVEHI